jgi:glycosyltransferase involved in cell wall biosynthesis
MAMGLPVLASTTPALLEITGDGALHADPEDHHDLVRQITMLDSDDDLRAELIEAGRRQAASFRWSRCAEQTLAVYREALG